MGTYEDFVARKLRFQSGSGLDVEPRDYGLFPHQRDLVKFALRRGRSAIFADTGLGKSRIQVAWADTIARETGGDVLILTPLAVAEQTVEEGASIGVKVTHARDGADIQPGINITNYARIHRFDCSRFTGVVLDESSIIKHHTSKTLQQLLEAFERTPFKLCATATPAPNDWTELGTHAQFLGYRTQAEMLAEFFVHDGGDTGTWRLKGHAKNLFWKWVASWGALLRSPADLGHDASAYALTPLNVTQHTVQGDIQPAEGMLFALEASSLMERRDARRASLEARVKACVLLIKNENSKLAANANGEFCDGLEEGVRGSEEAKSCIRSGVQGATKRSVHKGQGSKSGVHEGVLREESGEVPEAHSGAAGGVQRTQAREVCGVCGDEGEGKGCCSVVGAKQPGREESAATSCGLWNSTVGLQRHDGDAKQCVRDLRILGHERPENLPGCGSLPHDWESSRDSLLKLQSRTREVQGRRDEANACRSISGEKWLIWCDLNDEQDALERALQDEGISFVSIRGSTEDDVRIHREREWRTGSTQVLISKSKIFGWGLNWQHCARMAFVGVTDSFEAYYQAIRRCWRFGQKRSVHVHIFASEQEGSVVANLQRKEADAKAMAESLSAETLEAVRESVLGFSRETNDYAPSVPMAIPSFLRKSA